MMLWHGPGVARAQRFLLWRPRRLSPLTVTLLRSPIHGGSNKRESSSSDPYSVLRSARAAGESTYLRWSQTLTASWKGMRNLVG